MMGCEGMGVGGDGSLGAGVGGLQWGSQSAVK